MLDLARELHQLGVEVKFYSYVTKRRAREFGLPEVCHVGLLPYLWPLVAWERLLPRVFPRTIERFLCWALDVALIFTLQPCDILICMSGLYLSAPKHAKEKFRALVHLHRSSRHISSQREILQAFPDAVQVTPFIEKREIEGYHLADHIIVPSSHVVESFSPWPDLCRKTFLNPLGVDIDLFPFCDSKKASIPTVIFVGQWSFRKGVDVLVDAVRLVPSARLVHVGALADVPFPKDEQFVHHDHVPQRQLPKFYQQSHVLVLPSREDGFGVVLSQALASGLTVVCTDKTGGPDLAALPGLGRLIHIVPSDDYEALARAISQALKNALGANAVAPISDDERQMLGWSCYAQRDLDFMLKVRSRSDKNVSRLAAE